ncbi:MAG: hypothetical protein R3C61_00865 [Bacteroidia bacterium]
MKSLIHNRLLGPVVLGIWAGVAFRFVNGLMPHDEAPGSAKEDLTIVPVIEFRDDLCLLQNYPNPFAAFADKREKEHAQPDTYPLSGPLLPPYSRPPEAAYLGKITASNHNSTTGVLHMAGKTVAVAEGDTLMGYHVVQIHPEYVLISKKGLSFRYNVNPATKVLP